MKLCIPDKFFKFEIPKYKQIIQQKLKLSENHPRTSGGVSRLLHRELQRDGVACNNRR